MVFQVEATDIYSVLSPYLIAVVFHLAWVNISMDNMVLYLDATEVAAPPGWHINTCHCVSQRYFKRIEVITLGEVDRAVEGH